MPTPRFVRLPRMLSCTLVGAALLSLGGCAGVMRVDNQVESHALWGSSALSESATSYQFERLPSQQTGPQAQPQAALEGWVAQALATHGWRLQPGTEPDANATPPWRVTVSASHTTLPRAPWEEPADGRMWPRFGLPLGAGGRPHGLLLSPDMPYHLRSVSVVVRDGQRGTVVYETQARHDGRWNDSPELWQAMVQAALSGFPRPAAGVRQVDIDLPR